MFSNRCINDAALAKFLKQFARHFIGALIFGDFFTHNEHSFVAAHFLSHSVAQRVTHGCFYHLNIRRYVGFRFNFSGRCARLRRWRSSRFWRCLGFGRGGGCRRRAQIRGAITVFKKLQNHSANFYAVCACRHNNFADNAFVNALDFHRRFIRFYLGENIARGNSIALFNEPF